MNKSITVTLTGEQLLTAVKIGRDISSARQTAAWHDVVDFGEYVAHREESPPLSSVTVLQGCTSCSRSA